MTDLTEGTEAAFETLRRFGSEVYVTPTARAEALATLRTALHQAYEERDHAEWLRAQNFDMLKALNEKSITEKHQAYEDGLVDGDRNAQASFDGTPGRAVELSERLTEAEATSCPACRSMVREPWRDRPA